MHGISGHHDHARPGRDPRRGRRRHPGPRGRSLAGTRHRGTPPPTLATSAAAGRMAHARALRSRRPSRARSSARLHASAGMAHGRGRHALAASERPGSAGRGSRTVTPAPRGQRVLHHLHHHGPAGDTTQRRRCHRGERGRQSQGARRARKAPTALGAVRRGSGARTVAGLRRRRDGGDPGLPAAPPWSGVETIPLAPHPSDPGLDPR